MMNAYNKILTLAVVAGAMLVGSSASALTNYYDSWTSASQTSSYIGTIAPWGQYIAMQNNDTGACRFYLIGSTSSLNDNIVYDGGSGRDRIFIVRGTWSFCGYTMTAPTFGGKFLDLKGGVGNDLLASGVGNTWSYGDSGNDVVDDSTFAGTRAYGGTGNDRIHRGDSSSALYGDDGNDVFCVGDSSSRHTSSINGGAGTDCRTNLGTVGGTTSVENTCSSSVFDACYPPLE